MLCPNDIPDTLRQIIQKMLRIIGKEGADYRLRWKPQDASGEGYELVIVDGEQGSDLSDKQAVDLIPWDRLECTP